MFAKLVRFPIVRTHTALILLKTRHLGKKKKERWIVFCNLASKIKNSMREMKTTKAIKAIAILAIISAICACRKMDIDPQQMKDITLGEFPIDTVDSHHDWNLVQQMMVVVKVDVPDDDRISKVQILTGNPYTTKGTEIMAEKFTQSGSRVVLTFEMPITENDFWVAAINRDGKYYVVPSDNKDVFSFTGSDVISNGDIHQPTQQAFTYLFEQDFPLPGDFDFNDVVLRIAKESPSANILKLKVTLAAVGADKMMGACIRLQGINYDDVESVTIDEGTRFDENYPVNRYFISNDLLTKAMDGSAVINLFDDAHWVLNPTEKEGRIVRMHYNTTKYVKEDESATMPEQTRTYTIVAKEGKDIFSYVTLSNIDPFIIEAYNSLCMEVHTYKYKYTQALWQFHNGQTADDDHVAWAMLMPSSTFQYPVEGIPIGRYRNGEIFGAYSRLNHSFGQWGRNKDTSRDWWKYPNSAQVY